MSLFRVFKYSSILFFLGKYKEKLFKIVAVLLFALVTSLLYQDVAAYLELRHPQAVVYALVAKILIVYGALAFVLWQFRPEPDQPSPPDPTQNGSSKEAKAPSPDDRLSRLEDVRDADKLRSRYDRILSGEKK